MRSEALTPPTPLSQRERGEKKRRSGGPTWPPFFDAITNDGGHVGPPLRPFGISAVLPPLPPGEEGRGGEGFEAGEPEKP